MERNQILNENLIDQKVDEFINQVLVGIPSLAYTEFSYNYYFLFINKTFKYPCLAPS